MRRRALLLVFTFALAADGLGAQEPLLFPTRAAGSTVTPVFEGWYRNADGSVSLSFGYFNRNASEVIEIPVGPSNFFTGAEVTSQPTHFAPRRHWGVFAVRVPSDFAGKVTWTLVVRGDTFAIPGSMKKGWQIDALEGEAGSGNTPPVLRFAENGPESRGPAGGAAATMTATVGNPLTLDVLATDDGNTRGSVAGAGRGGSISLMWFKHQGPGRVTFNPANPAVPRGGGRATTTATFDVAGEYVLRVRANDSSVAGAGHSQCCWSNAFVKVTVR